MNDHIIYPHTATLFAAICACVFIVLGISGNLFTVVALFKSPKMRGHATTSFILSLSISDLLFCSFSLPLTAARYFEERWSFGNALCKIFPVIFYGNVAISLLSMVGITLNRYILISCHRLYAQIYKPKFLFLQLLFVWVISFVLLIPPILGIWGEMGLDEATFSCTIIKKNGRSIKKILFLIGFLLPCVVITISYSCIYLKVLKQKNIMKTHRYVKSNPKELTSSCGKCTEDDKLTVMMVTIFICFLLCFLPLMLANVVDDERNTSYPWLHIISSVMAWASSVINPFIYVASNRNYRVAYYKVIANMKFWGEPMSPLPSKSFHRSQNSKDFSREGRNTAQFQEVRRDNINQISYM